MAPGDPLGVNPWWVASGHSDPSTRWAAAVHRHALGQLHWINLWQHGLLPDFPRLNPVPGWTPWCGSYTTASVYYEGTNELTLNYLNGGNVKKRTGIVIADFPGQGLIREIIELNPWNSPPVVNAGEEQTVNEGDEVELDPATFTDADKGDTHTATVDWGDGIPVEPGTVVESAGFGTVSGRHIYADNAIKVCPTDTDGAGICINAYEVKVCVTDNNGATTCDNFMVTVNNVPPTVTATGSTIDENGVATVSGAITDPGSLDTFVGTIDWETARFRCTSTGRARPPSVSSTSTWMTIRPARPAISSRSP